MSSNSSTCCAPANAGDVDVATPDTAPSHRLVLMMATATGLGVACLYYAQPLLGVLTADLGLSARAVGAIPTLTQLGYALGILFLAPLGDRHDRRLIILVKAIALVVSLLAFGMASALPVLLVASLGIGLAATLAQDIVPAAATLAHDHQRGRIVGTVMTGLLLGILLSRVFSGLIAEQFGWRSVFMLAAVSMAVTGITMWRALPHIAPTTTLPYRALMASLLELLRRHPALRTATLAQGLLALAFSAFWSTLAVMLHEAPFHLGSAVAGAFGLAGAAGALIAPIAGHLADRRGPQTVTRVGTAITAASFVLMSAGALLAPHPQLWVLAIATVGFDLGVQSTLIAHQTIVYGLEPEARSRLNAILLGGMFIGMALGSALGSVLLGLWGWIAVTAMAATAAFAAFLIRLGAARRAAR
ncbi:MFS transporter [Nitrogeniibacter mangrovi]|uniref:MFS transporter n=1 Tax=Nitrogeniibacter mangrovi TaxID=2016596 RepID=A0A6C1B727_9RHOO|nr:MFS transporter [Nitrogeniibacter mangrovi]QID19163.1 MFS transporter [Nitrogeniibacter mangrovi]